MEKEKVKKIAQVALIGGGAVGVTVLAVKAVKVIRRKTRSISPTPEDVFGCSDEQPFVSQRRTEESETLV